MCIEFNLLPPSLPPSPPSLSPFLLSPWYSRATKTSQTSRYIVVLLNLNGAANNTMLKEAALKIIGSLSKNDMV